MPSDRIQLYEECCRLLLEDRDVAREVDLSDYVQLTLRQKRKILEDLAYWLIDNGWTSVARKDAETRVGLCVENIPKLSSNATGDEVTRLLVDRTLMVREPYHGEIDFTHRTFQEFLAANHAASERNIGRLVAAADKDEWHETIVLAAGVMPAKDRERLIKELLGLGDNDPKRRHQAYFLALSCLETCVDIPERLISRIRDGIRLVPNTFEEAAKVASAGEIAVPYLRFEENRRPRVNAACIRALGLIGGESAKAILAEYTSMPRGIELTSLIEACEANGGEYDDLCDRIGEIRVESLDDLTLALGVLDPNRVVIENSLELRLLDGAGRSVQDWELLDGDWIETFANLRELTRCRSLKIHRCDNLYDISMIADFAELESLELKRCFRVDELHSIADHKALQRIKLTECRALRDIRPLLYSKSLKEIEITGISSEVTIPKEFEKSDRVKIRRSRRRQVTET